MTNYISIFVTSCFVGSGSMLVFTTAKDPLQYLIVGGIGNCNDGMDGLTPNADTIAAMEELKAGKGKKFKSVEALFKSI